jgi:hypothetical protein
MCFLWGTNKVFVYQKTAFFVVKCLFIVPSNIYTSLLVFLMIYSSCWASQNRCLLPLITFCPWYFKLICHMLMYATVIPSMYYFQNVDIPNSPTTYLKHLFSDTEFCHRLQVDPTQLYSIDRAILSPRT